MNVRKILWGGIGNLDVRKDFRVELVTQISDDILVWEECITNPVPDG